MRTEELRADLNATLAELLHLVSSTDQEAFNVVPFEGGWTVGQLAKHLVMSGSGFADMLYGSVEETKRAPDEKVWGIKASFLDFNIKMKSPDFVVPANVSYDKDELLEALEDIKARLDQAAATLDLTRTCTSFEIPKAGFLTRYEALSFVLYHTQRHIHQLKQIRQEVVSPS